MTARQPSYGLKVTQGADPVQPAVGPCGSAGDETPERDVQHAADDEVREVGARAVARWAGLLRRLSE